MLKNASQSLRDERLISVRPGYSPMRYIASVSKLWDPNWVKQMLNDKTIQEHHLEKYKKLKLPKIDLIPSSNYDPLLRDRPKPYSRISLPELLFKKNEVNNLPDQNSLPEEIHVDNTSSGYAKSNVSDGNVLERKKRSRKMTMQMNRLQLGIPGAEMPQMEESMDEGESGSESEWGGRREASRRVVERTLNNLLEEPLAGAIQQQNRTNTTGDKRDIDRQSVNIAPVDYSNETSSISASTRKVEKGDLPDYTSLDTNQKEELISQLLLQGITQEATQVEHLISDEDADVAARSKRRATEEASTRKGEKHERASLPQSFSSNSSSKRGGGFRGNALHSSLPSANSSKSKSSKDSSSKKSNPLMVSSVGKLPPIKSEPATPIVNEKKGTHHFVTLPPLTKKATSKVPQKSSEIEGDLSALFVGGRAIEITDVEVAVSDDKNSEEGISETGDDLIKLLTEEEIAGEEERNPIDTEASQGNVFCYSVFASYCC